MASEQVTLDKVRNIGIIAHIDAGKTTMTERILYYTGVIHRLGSVDEGNTVTDYMEQEKERGITIVAANTTTFWKHFKINIIDTPGHVDFTIEVERSLKVLDGAVIVLCSTSGVQSQTETVWRQAERYHVPRIAFINKVDRLGADFERVLGQIYDRLGANAAPINIPDAHEDAFRGIIDLVNMKYITYKDVDGLEMEVSEIPAQFMEKANKFRHLLIEKVAEADDPIMEKYLHEQPVTTEELKAGIRRGVLKAKFLPVLAGTALKNRGVQMVLDAVTDYLPSPLEVRQAQGKKPRSEDVISCTPADDQPLASLVFKVASDPYVGKLFYTRIYSGTISSGDQVYNSNRDKNERISKILLMHANKQEILTKAGAGEIVALVGLKESKNGDTLCREKDAIVLESMRVPEPVVSMALEPKTKADQDKLGIILRKFLDEDPSLRVEYDHETSQTIISGMGELHLEIIIDRMKREHNLDANIGRPQVAYKETITRKADKVVGKFISQSGGRGQYGHVVFNVAPAPKGTGVQFVDEIFGGVIPREYIKSIEAGVETQARNGILAGYPVTDITVALIDGSYHDVDSSDIAFQLAAKIGLKEALAKANSVFTEPIMAVEIAAPEEFMGSVIGDMNTRRAKITELGSMGNVKTVRADVPLAEMFNYANALRSLTQGRASFSMEPSYYAQVPNNVSEKIVGARQEYLNSRKK
ncbi:MAG: elongation factor G [Candidatus Omnitrophica bacterium]|nr:elongation factor G [Candidatus Omnitrophota bacterium]